MMATSKLRVLILAYFLVALAWGCSALNPNLTKIENSANISGPRGYIQFTFLDNVPCKYETLSGKWVDRDKKAFFLQCNHDFSGKKKYYRASAEQTQSLIDPREAKSSYAAFSPGIYEFDCDIVISHIGVTDIGYYQIKVDENKVSVMSAKITDCTSTLDGVYNFEYDILIGDPSPVDNFPEINQ